MSSLLLLSLLLSHLQLFGLSVLPIDNHTTALTAGLYGRAHPEWLFDPGTIGQALRTWILLLSALAGTPPPCGQYLPIA